MASAEIALRSERRGSLGARSLGLTVAVGVAGALLVLVASGFRPLLVRSGSMEPAIMTGDAIVTRLVPPGSLRAGDIVTFRDATRGNDLVTHRVIRVRAQGRTFAFVTRGDANDGVERWSVAADGSVGRYVLRIPRAGYLMAWASAPRVRVVLLALGGLPLAAISLRRIWGR